MKPLLALAALLLCFSIPTRAQTMTTLQQANAAYAQKSYARALPLYKAALADGSATDKDETRFRIAVSEGETEAWTQAISDANALLKDTTWKARVLYFLGRLHTKLPDEAYRIKGPNGTVTYYGDDYPKIEGAAKPELVYIDEENATKTLDYLEQAKVQAAQEQHLLMVARFAAGTPIHPLSRKEVRDLNFDLAAFLPTRELDEFIKQLEAGKGGNENVDLKEPYDRAWSLPKKVFWLYGDIRRIASEDTDENGKLQASAQHDAALSLLAQGLFTRAYRQRLDAWAPKYDDVKKVTVTRPYPFDDADELNAWRRVVKEYQGDAVADKTQLLIAQTLNGRGELVKALAEYRVLIAKFPKSRFVSDARSAMQQITRRALSLGVSGQQKPGARAKLTVSSNNLKTVAFSAYRVKLENYLARASNLAEPRTVFTNFEQNFGDIGSFVKGAGAPVATWTIKTQDKSDYKPVSESVETPLQKRGAYVVVAQSGGVQFAQLIVLSDLALLKKTDRDNAFVYVADAASGHAVANVQVVLKETFYDSVSKADIARGVADDGGFFDKKLARGAGVYSSNVQAFAWSGDRYAITGASWSGYYSDNKQELKIYAYTDRPVYRPAQTVYFRQILTRRNEGGDQAPATNVPVAVRVQNPKGETFYNATLKTSEFGTVNGEFQLPAGAALGEYTLNATTQATKQQIASSGANRFRVEEYKRPEFEVSVDAPDVAVRPGEVVAAKIAANYYFGAPVPNARVKYTVRRSTWWASYRFPQPFEWLYSYWGAGDYDTSRRNIGGESSGEIIKEGTATTDAKGLAEVSFTATQTPQADANDWWRRYQNPLYTIEVEVTDASRRTIEGQGVVRVAEQSYFAFVRATRGYFQSGDRAQFEVRTQNANDKPIAASGQMVVYRLLPGDKEERVFSENVKTDATGKVFWTWEIDTSGQFRVAFEGADDRGTKIVGADNVWVAGPELDTRTIRLSGVTIVLEKRDFREGEALKALLIADKPGTTVLLTQEAGGDILRRDVVTIVGRSREITIPITHRHVPNFFLSAATVRDYDVFQAQEEVFVPPANQLISVQVSGDKAEYKPGERGIFNVKATDANGKAARAEVSLALFDSSLLYIQKGYAPDIRVFYYGERRGNGVNLDSSRSGNPQGRVEDDNPLKPYKTHGFELPDDLGQLQLDPGGFGYYGYGGYYRREGDSITINGAASLSRSAPMALTLPQESTASDTAATSGAGAAPSSMRAAGKAQLNQSAPLAQAKTRDNFAETAFWSPAVVTQNGAATLKVTFPDSLTRWTAEARGLTTTAQVGAGETSVETRKNLLVRLQAPRFFVQRDEAVLTANVQNYLKTAKRVRVSLNLTGGLQLATTSSDLQLVGTNLSAATGDVDVPAGGEMRVNWRVSVPRDGRASVKMSAQTDEESDAVQMSFPVLVHGVQRFASQSGVMRNNGKQTVTIQMPKERRFGASQLNAQFNPSLAATMLDALPYLADYPYGCVEQTTSRFVPTVIAAKTLRDAGLNLDTLRQRALKLRAESQTQAIGARVQNTGYSYPKGQPNARDLDAMSSQLWHTSRWENPVYDPKRMSAMIAEGLQRLYAMQRGDGGWGWWQGSPDSDPYMSAYVMRGLFTAREAGVNVKADVLSRGFDYLEKQLRDEENIHLLTAVADSLSLRDKVSDASRKIISGRLFEQRARLTAYSKALLAMSLYRLGEKQKAQVMLDNLENTAKVDAQNATAHWAQNRDWWHWWNNDPETNAIALRAFLLIEPKNKLAPMLMKWLVTNARGNRWRSTKETAEAVYALAEYTRVFRELEADYTLKVSLNGKLARTYRVTRENALLFDNRFIAGDLFLENGANTLTVEKSGHGALYWSAASEYFSLEEPIKASGNEIFVKRRMFALTRNPDVKPEQSDAPEASSTTTTTTTTTLIAPPQPRDTQPAPQEYTRRELKDSASLKSGDLVEVELTVDAANDYEYLVFEDMKAAGLEPVELRSGSDWGNGLSSNVELRDEKVAFFVDSLPQGTRVLRYRMRVEIPGQWHALPTNAYAMYAPEVRAISDEARMGVSD